MSRKRTTYSTEIKTKLVLELLKRPIGVSCHLKKWLKTKENSK